MKLRKVTYSSYVPTTQFYKQKTAQSQIKPSIKILGSGVSIRIKNPKVSQLETKIEDLKSRINKDPAMLPAKKAEIEAEIEQAKFKLKSEPPTIELQESTFIPKSQTIDYIA